MLGPDDTYDYDHLDEDEEGISVAEKRKAVADGKKRQETAFGCSLILGLDEDDSSELRSYYGNRLGSSLSQCDKCIYNWHMGRKAFLKKLSE